MASTWSAEDSSAVGPQRVRRHRGPRWKPVPYQRPETRERFRRMAEQRWKMMRALEWAMVESLGRGRGVEVRKEYDHLVAAGMIDPERRYPRLGRRGRPNARCLRCGHRWRRRLPRSKVLRCPRCKSPYWRTRPRSCG